MNCKRRGVYPDARARRRRVLRSFSTELRAAAATIANKDVREQYLATFNGLLWDLFHPERPSSSYGRFAKREAVQRPVSDRVREINAKGIDQAVIIPALFKGLLRFPEMIAPLAEILVCIEVQSRPLRQARLLMLDAALANQSLETSELRSILERDALGPVLKAFERVSLAFSFLDARADPDVAKRDLTAVMDVLAAKPQLDRELAEAQVAFKEQASEGAFQVLERLLHDKRELDEAFRDAIMAGFEAEQIA